MKSILAIAAAAVATLGLAAQANAFKLSPAGAWSATGPTTLSAGGQTINCTATFTGKISQLGTGQVTGFKASGADPRCGYIVATLPWGAKAYNATTIAFQKVAVGVPGVVTCGPGSLKVTDNASGLITYNTVLNPGACAVSSTGIQTTPHVVIH